MTAQVTEVLIYQGQRLALCSEPLADYFAITGKESPFKAPHTALWRGYVGTWEVIDGRIYLIGLNGHLREGRHGDLSLLFPEYPHRVFAHWLNRRLRATRGEQLEYIHAGYASVYEEDLFFQFETGILISMVIKDNRKTHIPDGFKEANL